MIQGTHGRTSSLGNWFVWITSYMIFLVEAAIMKWTNKAACHSVVVLETERKAFRSMIVTLYWDKDASSFLAPKGKILLLLFAAPERMYTSASALLLYLSMKQHVFHSHHKKALIISKRFLELMSLHTGTRRRDTSPFFYISVSSSWLLSKSRSLLIVIKITCHHHDHGLMIIISIFIVVVFIMIVITIFVLIVIVAILIVVVVVVTVNVIVIIMSNCNLMTGLLKCSK